MVEGAHSYHSLKLSAHAYTRPHSNMGVTARKGIAPMSDTKSPALHGLGGRSSSLRFTSPSITGAHWRMGAVVHLSSSRTLRIIWLTSKLNYLVHPCTRSAACELWQQDNIVLSHSRRPPWEHFGHSLQSITEKVFVCVCLFCSPAWLSITLVPLKKKSRVHFS